MSGTAARGETPKPLTQPVPHPEAPPSIRRRDRLRAWLVAFWRRAYRENITGLSGMVAYNLVLALFPFTLLVLFIFARPAMVGEMSPCSASPAICMQ